MTYEEVYKMFLEKTKIPIDEIEDYRPCCNLFGVPDIRNGIVVWLKNGSKLIYIHDTETPPC